jgi:hypothetical protein
MSSQKQMFGKYVHFYLYTIRFETLVVLLWFYMKLNLVELEWNDSMTPSMTPLC